jgi:protein-S-isoprenylcysteine O-methyltransferase
MTLPSLSLLASIWGAVELCIAFLTHSKSGGKKDRGSLYLIWIVCGASVGLGIFLGRQFHSWKLPLRETLRWTGYGLFVAGVMLRWYSMFYLGKFFTPNVVILEKHRLIQSGPYRFIRHPTYTGVLAAATGLTLNGGNLLSLLVILIPIFIVVRWRIQIEEAVLVEAFGDEYRNYLRRTWRLLPGIY